eukprot:3688671-Prymnesium_polylepis.1
MASEALGAIVYQDIGEGCSCERCELSAVVETAHLHEPVASPDHQLCSSPTAMAVRMAAEPVTDGQPVNIVQNISDDLLDGGAELHHLT